MIYSRDEHNQFLAREKREQNIEYAKKINTNALLLLKEKENIYIAMFKNDQPSQMILTFSTKRLLPKINEHLYCFIVPKEYRDYRN